MTRRAVAVSSLLGAVVLLAACSGGTSAGRSDGAPVAVSGSTTALHGTAITAPYPLPAQRFTATDGAGYRPDRDAKKPVTLVFFGYTHCPDVCNVVLANVASALRRAPDDVRRRTELLFVTTDPDRDTAKVVRDYLDRFDPSYVGLRADVATTKRAAASLHIAYEGKDEVVGGGYEVTHGTQVTGFRDGLAAVVWDAETTVADLRADLTTLAAAAS